MKEEQQQRVIKAVIKVMDQQSFDSQVNLAAYLLVLNETSLVGYKRQADQEDSISKVKHAKSVSMVLRNEIALRI